MKNQPRRWVAGLGVFVVAVTGLVAADVAPAMAQNAGGTSNVAGTAAWLGCTAGGVTAATKTYCGGYAGGQAFWQGLTTGGVPALHERCEVTHEFHDHNYVIKYPTNTAGGFQYAGPYSDDCSSGNVSSTFYGNSPAGIVRQQTLTGLAVDRINEAYSFFCPVGGCGTDGVVSDDDPGAPRPLTYDQAEPLGKCSRVLEPLDGAWYATFKMEVTNRPPAGPYLPGAGPFAQDFVSLDLPWAAPTFEDDQYSWRAKLPAVSEQPAGGWLPRFHVRRRLLEHHGFTRPGKNQSSYIVSTGAEPYKGSEEVTLTCALVVDLSDPDKGSEGGLGGFLPDVEQTAENFGVAIGACIPAGLGVLNPKNFVTALGCVLRVSFVPTTLNPIAQLRAHAETTVIADATTAVGVVTASYGVLKAGANNTGTGCEGPSYSIPLAPGSNAAYKPFSTCDGGTGQMAATMRLLALVGLYLTFGLAIVRMLAAGMGLAWGPVDRAEKAEVEAIK